MSSWKTLAKSLRTFIGGEYSLHVQIQAQKFQKFPTIQKSFHLIRCYIILVVDFDIGQKYSKCRIVQTRTCRNIELLSLSGPMRFHRDASLLLPLYKAIELFKWTRVCLLLPYLRELTFIEASPKSFSVGIMRRCFHEFVLHVSDEVICASWNDKCFASVSNFKLNCT